MPPLDGSPPRGGGSRLGSSRFPWWLLAAALLPRLALCAIAWTHPERAVKGDSRGYLALARNLVEHRAFSISDGAPFAPETFRTPGYPVFLAAVAAVFDSPERPAALLQSLLGALAVLAAWRWFGRFASARGAAVGALFLAFDPVTLFHTPLIMTEALFLFLLVILCGRLWEGMGAVDAKQAAFSGLLLGFAILVRPIALYMPISFAWLFRRRLAALAVWLAASYVLPIAWMLRNRAVSGEAQFSSVGGIDLLRYAAGGVESRRTGRPWSEVELELRERVDLSLGDDVPPAVRARAYQAAAMEILQEHPGLLARHCAVGTVKILAGTGLEMLLEWTRGEQQGPTAGEFRAKVTGQGTRALLARTPWLIPIQLAYWLALGGLYSLAAAGLLRLCRDGRSVEAVFLLVGAAYFIGLASFEGYYRYRIPAMPFLAALGAMGMSRKI